MRAYISNKQRPKVTVNTTNLELIQIYWSRWNVKSNVSFYIQPIGSRDPSFLGTKSTLWCHYPIHHFSLLFLWKAVSSTPSYGPLSTDPKVLLFSFLSGAKDAETWSSYTVFTDLEFLIFLPSCLRCPCPAEIFFLIKFTNVLSRSNHRC